MNESIETFKIQSYIDTNREKIDESLVSLRLMKEIDNFTEFNKISNKDLAFGLGYSESYISQLMSGVKKFNASFINKFEKKYEVKVDFKILLNSNDNAGWSTLKEKLSYRLDFNMDFHLINNSTTYYSFNRTNIDKYEIEETEFVNL